MTLLTKTNFNFLLDNNTGLCRLDAASTLAANMCSSTVCPYPTCACTKSVCPSGAPNSGSLVANPATPFYPGDDVTCCVGGATLREQLVTDLHLDCSVGRPCIATMGAPGKGTQAGVISYNAVSLTGTIPPEIGDLIALTKLYLSSNKMTGTIPPEVSALTALTLLSVFNNKLTDAIPSAVGILTAMKLLELYSNNLSGQIPATLTLLTATTSVRLDTNPGLCRLDAGSTAAANKCTVPACPYPTCACTYTACPSGATNSGLTALNPATPFYPADDATCCLSVNSLRERLVSDLHLDCSAGRPCAAVGGTVGLGTQVYKLTLDNQSLSGTICPQIGQLTSLTFLRLDVNKITGTLPVELFSLLRIQYFDLSNNILSSSIPTLIGSLTALTSFWLNSNKLTGPIPGTMTLLTNTFDYFRLATNPGLCRLDAASTLVANKCFPTTCPYPTCACTETVCPSGAIHSTGYTAINTSSPYYPADDALCCPAGSSLQERLVTDLHLDCSFGRPCLAATNAPGKGTLLTILLESFQSLSGTIPPALGDFTSLTQIRLDANKLSGSIPPEIGNLANALEQLRFENNKLTGSIPTEIGKLTKFTIVKMQGNKLTGPIPGTMTLLTKTNFNFLLDNNPSLCRLDAASTLAANMCSSTVCPYPTCACTETACPSGGTNSGSPLVNPATPFYPADDATCCPVGASLLEKLISENHLDCTAGRPCVATTGTSGKGVLAINVTLGSYSLTSTIPPEISEMTLLEFLSLENNNLMGSIPPEISKLKALTTLYIYNSKLTGSIPPEISKLTALSWLYLSSNSLTGSVPPEISELTALTQLYLASNKLTGSIPPEMSELTAMVQLRLANNKLTGAIPGTLTLLTKTTYFWLDANLGLCRLDAASTTVTTTKCTTACPYPTCACTVATCPSGATNSGSTVVNPATPFYPADDTSCCPVGASLLEKLVTDQHLDCSAGRPCVATTGVGKGTNAVVLPFNNLILTGTIPPEIGQMTKVARLYLYNNEMTGTIPPEISLNVKLTQVYLYGNKLSGTIPPEISELSIVQYLLLRSNDLTGTIPPEVSKLTALLHLYLYNNELTGTIPDEMGELTEMSLL
jgi:Leucine-rich repeat (LRR) protein